MIVTALNNYLKTLAPFILAALMLACGNGKNKVLAPYGEPFATIMKTDTGIFRGVDMGMSSTDVKVKEGQIPKEEEKEDGTTYLYYEQAIDSSSNYAVAYYFPGEKLNTIETDIYLLTENQGAATFEAFKKFFETTYGKYETDGDFYLWTRNANGHVTRIALADESATYKQGKVTLIIHENEE